MYYSDAKRICIMHQSILLNIAEQDDGLQILPLASLKPL